MSSIPGQGTKIQHAAWPKKKLIAIIEIPWLKVIVIWAGDKRWDKMILLKDFFTFNFNKNKQLEIV